VEDQVEADRQFGAFCQAVERLPKQCRKVFTLKQVYGLSQKEIAERLGINEKTVEYHVSRGLLYCRRYLSAVQSGSELPDSPDRTSRGIRGIRQ
jgi:RNA polymerase sigma-70 factor (ECF subfamily)